MKVFVVMRQLSGPSGSWSEPILSFSSQSEAENASRARTEEVKGFAHCTVALNGKDSGRTIAELLTALGIDGIGYFSVEMETREADLLKPAAPRILVQ